MPSGYKADGTFSNVIQKGQHISPKTEFKKGHKFFGDLSKPNYFQKGQVLYPNKVIPKGNKCHLWIDGRSKDKEFKKKYMVNWKRANKEKTKLYNKKRKALKRAGGKLTLKRIQMVYEDNIKKYGTLTCYLCYKPIEFRKDCLEHRIPLSRGGTNEYVNLGIAHCICNNKKRNKTEEEYRNVI